MTPQQIAVQIAETLHNKSISSRDLAVHMDRFALTAAGIMANRDLAKKAKQLATLSRQVSALCAQMAEQARSAIAKTFEHDIH